MVLHYLNDASADGVAARQTLAEKILADGAAYALRWHADDLVQAEAAGRAADELLGVLRRLLDENGDASFVETWSTLLAQTVERWTFASPSDTYSGRFSNDVERSAREGVRKLYDRLHWSR